MTWIRSAKLSSCRLLLPVAVNPLDPEAVAPNPDVDDEAVLDEEELGVDGVATEGDWTDVEGKGEDVLGVAPVLLVDTVASW